MNEQQLIKLAERMTGMFGTTDCWSIRGRGAATVDCDIAIDTVYESRLPSEMLPDLVIKYWVEPVSYDGSLTRHKFIIATN